MGLIPHIMWMLIDSVMGAVTTKMGPAESVLLLKYEAHKLAFESRCGCSWAPRLNWDAGLTELHVWTGTRAWLSSTFELECELSWTPCLNWNTSLAELRILNWNARLAALRVWTGTRAWLSSTLNWNMSLAELRVWVEMLDRLRFASELERGAKIRVWIGMHSWLRSVFAVGYEIRIYIKTILLRWTCWPKGPSL